MVIVAEVPLPVVNPSGRRINQPCGIQLADSLRKLDLRIIVCYLTPAFIIDYLRLSVKNRKNNAVRDNTQEKMLG
jgi:hypothetical protein